MDFDSWQIDRIRVALNNYRLFNGRNGQLRSWQGVCDDLVLEDRKNSKTPRRKALPDFRGEALRRFANGTQVLEVDRLRYLREFLIRERFLAEDEMQEAPEEIRGLLIAQNYIASQSVTAALTLEKLEGLYVTTARMQHPVKEIQLTFTRAESRLFARADEESIVLRHPAMSGNLHRKLDRVSVRELRRGLAFATTTADTLHVYLVGATKAVEVTYTQITAGETLQPEALMLLRSGGEASPLMPLSEAAPISTRSAFVFRTRSE